jgi:hypothetical protein
VVAFVCVNGELSTVGFPRATVTIYEAQADVVRRIFREYADGVSLSKLIDWLNRGGIPAPADDNGRRLFVDGRRASSSSSSGMSDTSASSSGTRGNGSATRSQSGVDTANGPSQTGFAPRTPR